MAWMYVTAPTSVAPGVTINGSPMGGSPTNPGDMVGIVIDAGRSVAQNFFMNGGTILANSLPLGSPDYPDAFGILGRGLDGRAVVANLATGVIQVSAGRPDGDAFGFLADEVLGPSFWNAGLIEVTATHLAVGLESLASYSKYSNSGALRVTSDQDAIGVKIFDSAEKIPFENSGLIQVSANSGHAIGVHLEGYRSSFLNKLGGVIRATEDGHHSTGVYIANNSPVALTHVNLGLIEGDTAVELNNRGRQDTLTFSNGDPGVIRGKVIFHGGSEKLLNDGLVVGDVNLGDGADVYEGRSGQVVGMVSGEGGNDSLQGGEYFDYLHGNVGNDTVNGGVGDDWVVGGKDNDLLFGDDGGDVVWGNLGDDTQHGDFGNDQVRGGQGDDVIYGGSGDDYVSGDRGNDTITGGRGGDRFHGSQDAGIDRVLDFNRLEGDRVLLDPGTTYTLRQAGEDTIIDMGGGHQMILVGVQHATLSDGWIVSAWG